MAYIGNPIYQSAFVTDTFSGNGTTTAFTMAVAPAGTTNVLVVVSGVVQDPSTYGVVGNTITFSQAPPTGTNNISCRYLGVPVTGVTTTAYRTLTEFTATAGQTTFTPPSYTVGFINVYRNGVLLGSADYTATNGTTVVLATGATAGDLVTVESFLVSSVLNAIPNTVGAVSSTNLATNSVTTTKIADANVTTAKLASTTGSGAVVLATSPTLVTPALGTPSSLVLTNATGLLAGALPAGSILQVVNFQENGRFSYSGSWQNTNITANITPRSTSSRILCLIQLGRVGHYDANSLAFRMLRNGSLVGVGAVYGSRQQTTAVIMRVTTDSNHTQGALFLSFVDSPSSTSALTYTMQAQAEGNTTWYLNRNGSNTDGLQEYNSTSQSNITLMEIAG